MKKRYCLTYSMNRYNNEVKHNITYSVMSHVFQLTTGIDFLLCKSITSIPKNSHYSNSLVFYLFTRGDRLHSSNNNVILIIKFNNIRITGMICQTKQRIQSFSNCKRFVRRFQVPRKDRISCNPFLYFFTIDIQHQ